MVATWSGSRSFTFDHADDAGSFSFEIHHKGEGPPILILQELPGVGKETFALADRLIDAGFSVYLPNLIGRFGQAGPLWAVVNGAKLFCVRREFNMFLAGEQSPVAAWMRAACAEISERNDGARLGVIGMCLTGSFVIPLMAEDAVTAAVASQPALPMRKATELHMSQDDVAVAKAAMEQKGSALAMRYEDDRFSTAEHFAAFERAFGDLVETVVYPSGKRGDHSLLTLDFSEQAYVRTEAYFKDRFGLN
jgi:dienelactone hydrolase